MLSKFGEEGVLGGAIQRKAEGWFRLLHAEKAFNGT